MSTNRDMDGGKLQDDPIKAAKRRIFLSGTPIGILVMLAVWGISLKQNVITVSSIFILPLLAISFLTLVILLWQHIIPLQTFELILYALVLMYALGEFLSIIINATFNNQSFSPNFTLWLPFVYILGFLILSTKRALLLSVIFFLITLLLGLTSGLYFMIRGMVFPNTTLLVQVYFASGFYIAVLYLIAQLKERYISERLTADAMRRLAITDSLTQVNNRRVLTQYLEEEVERAERHNQPLSILLFDLDHFKKINDRLGHNTGDKVLQKAASLLWHNIRTCDSFGRWGGDEFLCLAVNTGPEQAIELAERLRQVLQECSIANMEKITASFGVTTYQKGDSPETLIRRADLGLYKAKAGGRNRIEAVLAGITLPIFEGERPSADREDEGD